MAREKIKIRKIDNTTARQVTFSKRRRGLFKKAKELAILCDAEVGVILLSSNGKLFEYSSNSMKAIIERHNKHSRDDVKSVRPSHDHCVKGSIRGSLSKDVLESRLQLREDIGGLTLEELQNLEKALEIGLCRVLTRKGQQMVGEIKELQHKSFSLLVTISFLNGSPDAQLNIGRFPFLESNWSPSENRWQFPPAFLRLTRGRSTRYREALPEDSQRIADGESIGHGYLGVALTRRMTSRTLGTTVGISSRGIATVGNRDVLDE
ncbi:unnamed protein product [Spirodela intermedia]|uniref:MADS-box domain-containing protein n=1 Tax=Spirodela intermedia TaxID=51605 RepID=A0A7I8J2A9_SPIIN|nr:unnamed protein product [Spirodela intermedia]CAA6664355.1 unnamed protein product [Spirodela intermedia]